MCLLTYFPPGTEVDKAHRSRLLDGGYVNSDGHGFGLVDGQTLIVSRGLELALVLDRFERVRRDHPDGYAMFHSRWGTAGSVDKANCHPYRLGSDRRTILAHNGVLPHKAQPRPGDQRSDTRILAESILPTGRLGYPFTKRGRKRLANWLGPQNKVVILTTNPMYDRQAYLLNSKYGHWVAGVWYSNASYDWPIYASPKGAQGTIWPKGDSGPISERTKNTRAILANTNRSRDCRFCDTYNSVGAFTGLCTLCYTCSVCGAWADLCECFDKGAMEYDLRESNYASRYRGTGRSAEIHRTGNVDSATDDVTDDTPGTDIVLGRPAFSDGE